MLVFVVIDNGGIQRHWQALGCRGGAEGSQCFATRAGPDQVGRGESRDLATCLQSC